MKYKVPVVVSIFFIVGIFLFINLVYTQNSDIVITEIGAYESDNHEWIEIYNKGDDVVDIEGWKFLVEGESRHGINLTSSTDSFFIEPDEYIIIAENDINFLEDYSDFTGRVFDSSWGGINEDGSKKIGLEDVDGVEIEYFNYPAAPNFSLERKDINEPASDESNWQEHPDGNTVGVRNYWAVDNNTFVENQAPVATISASPSVVINEVVVFDASGSSDSDGSITSYVWDFGDGNIGNGVSVNNIYTSTGTFSIVLIVTDDDSENSTTSFDITVNNEEVVPVETSTSTSQTLVINEFAADIVSGENEWIEIYNFSTTSIDLDGWTLSDGVGVIASPTGTVNPSSFFVIDLTSNKLNNLGDIIILKNIDEEVIDQVSYGNWDDGNTADNAPKADDPNSIARSIDGQDTDNDKNDWVETTMVTKGLPNVIVASVEDDTSSTSGGGGGNGIITIPTATYNLGDVLISEIVSDPTDGEEEFVEIYNTTSQTISLGSWWLEDGSETKTNLEGSILAGGFFVIEKPKGNLNNAGDIIILFSPDGKEIDKVTFGTWDDGNVNDNAPAPGDPLSLVRKSVGQDSDNDYYDFVLTSTVTKGKSNIISIVTQDGEVVEQMVGSTEIVINEILPNPEGSDSEDEFIELKNLGKETIDLKNWSLGDASSKRYKITQGSIKPSGLFLFKRSMTGIALNNTGGDEVKLYSPNSSLVDNIKYTGSAGGEEAYARKDDTTWAWTIKPTPGKENIVAGKSAAPIVSIDVDTEVAVNEPILFDASDTTDPEAEDMSFVWNFGDGRDDSGEVVEHSFSKEGVYTVKLIVTDSSGNEAEKKVIINVKSRFAFMGGYFADDNVVKVEISEFIPNPEGSDTTEFVEIFNPTDDDVDLFDFKLDDEEGGSRAYTFPENTIIPAKSYEVFGRQDTKLALNNTSDSVRLLYPDGTILQEVRYDDVPEGASYVQDENEVWQWTISNTPGEANIITSVIEKTSSRTVSRSKTLKPIINTTLENLRNEDVGDKVKVTGVVAVEPGVLGTQYFYIVGSPGVQVYMYKKDFPNLKIGDRIEVTGEITESYGNTRVKLASRDDIKKIDHPGDPQPKVTEVAEVQEQLEGWLVEVHGEITELKGSYMYIDDGTEEVKVYFKRGAGINKQIYQVGDLVKVRGLVYQTKSEYQILPRFPEDIEKTGVAENMVVQMENTEGEDKKEVAEKYLTATAGGLTSILFGLFAKSRGSSALGFIKKLAGIGVAFVRRKPKV